MSLDNLKNFVESKVAPNLVNINSVDPFGDFKVVFKYPKYPSDFSLIFSYQGLQQKNLNNESINPLFEHDVHQYIKSINDMELNINAKSLEMPGITYALHRLMPMNPKNSITMEWLNTKIPFIEWIFIPWMKKNTIDGQFPIIKCDLAITFPKLPKISENEIQYWYYGVRPIEVGLHKMTNQALTEFYRRVTFDYDYFYIKTHKDEEKDLL